ncbi:VP2 [Norovirus GII/Hu/JP/2011/GII/Yuzawa/Gira2HS]|uniref:VP2 n=1 Tax=Norovirus GII/Hu/JP/2011/GII/Yuzawa/Gira2HS TaxID=1529924 RepID=A0A076JAH5_NORV|nr:VP2 [Norovirus GII/Hu/JP/2011/GII/Yuzawa/Gira2HS]AII73763.1 VP2 [Norovirus GII/Hu/JP/2011/GII/Yuzawa/Gira2HS]
MAGAFFAGLGADLLTTGVSSLVSAGATAINQRAEFEYNKALQQSSFQHDKEMLQAQIAATANLQKQMIDIKREILTQGGFSPTDAARGSVGANMTQILDWSGTRYYAPGAMRTTPYSGNFLRQSVPHTTPKANYRQAGQDPSTESLYSGSWSGSYKSGSTNTTAVSASTASSRTSDWVSQHSNLAPFHENALRTAYVSPPSTVSSHSVSTVRGSLLDSWTPAFNTHRQPAFAHLRKRGISEA